MRAYLKLLVLLFLLTNASSIFYPASSPLFTFSGRRYIANETIRFDWPCFRIAFCFQSSTKAVLHIKDTWNNYNVIIDNGTSTTIQPAKNS